MKKMLVIGLMLAMVLMAIPAFAGDYGYFSSGSHYDANTSGVSTHTNSSHVMEVYGSGSATGENWAGGQAVTTHDVMFTPPIGFSVNGCATQNFGEAIGGFNYSIKTGNENYSETVLPTATAIAGIKGDVSQASSDGTFISGTGPTGGVGSASSFASQTSAAGFIGADADVLTGYNLRPHTGAFTGHSVVEGGTYSYSYKGTSGNTRYIGTESGAWNLANTTITGGIGSDYAGGSGRTSGSSFVNTGSGFGSTFGTYTGYFSYLGNGFGNVAGYSQSYGTALPHGAIVGTISGVSVNVSQ